MKVRWTPRAEADLETIVLYVARDDVDAAIRLESRILAATEELQMLPDRDVSAVYPTPESS